MRETRADWQTPISTAKAVDFVSLVDDLQTLSITFWADDRKICFRWSQVCAYRNTLEEHGFPWDVIPPQRMGATGIAKDSTWIEELRKGNDLLDIHAPGLKHFVIANSSYVTEVLSAEEPEVQWLD